MNYIMEKEMSDQETVHYTREVLMKMNDNQLSEMLGYLKNKIESGKKSGGNMQVDEVEFCYLQDEFFRRSRYNNRSRDRNHPRDRNRRPSRGEAVRPRRHIRNNNQ